MCTNPIVARVVGTTPAGKKRLQFLSDNDTFVRGAPFFGPPEPKNKYFSTSARRFAAHHRYSDDDIILIPCGKCAACNLARAKEWSARMALELPYYDPDSVFFLTITYDDMHVPWHISDNTDYPDVQTLCKRDIQLLIKRIRKSLPSRSFRYYVVGEYGPHTLRPHYHAIFYGLKFPDLIASHKSHSGSLLYESNLMYSFWSDSFGTPKGNVFIAPVSVKTCLYCARYTAKKMMSFDFPDSGAEPPFQLMSQKPPMARRWYEENDWIYLDKTIPLCYNGSVENIPIPSVFYRWLAVDDPDLAAELISDRRSAAESLMEGALSKTSLPLLDYLSVVDDNLKSRLSRGKRSDF